MYSNINDGKCSLGLVVAEGVFSLRAKSNDAKKVHRDFFTMGYCVCCVQKSTSDIASYKDTSPLAFTARCAHVCTGLCEVCVSEECACEWIRSGS